MTATARRYLPLVALIVILAVAAFYGWRAWQPAGLPSGIASGNGRIEAVEIDVATKLAGRLQEVAVREGDFVTAGQVIARMNTDQLQAQRREAEAQLRRARIGIRTAGSVVTQRQAERMSAEAVLAQREAEREAAERRVARTEQLARGNNAPLQLLDDDRARVQGAIAATGAARAQLAAAEAGIGAAESQVVDAEAAVEAAQATLQRIDVEIADSTLRAPRDGRVQYLVSQPGEVLVAGGRVLNLIDVTDVFMTFFLPTEQAGRAAYGAEGRIILDAAPRLVIPAEVSFVSDTAQFTPRTVETALERQKLMFRIRLRIPPALLRQHMEQVKTGLPGIAYVRLDPATEWPAALRTTIAP
jgi:HlyD family secretion protein